MRATDPTRHISICLLALLVLAAGPLQAQTGRPSASTHTKATAARVNPRGFVPRHQRWPAETRVASADPSLRRPVRGAVPAGVSTDAASPAAATG